VFLWFALHLVACNIKRISVAARTSAARSNRLAVARTESGRTRTRRVRDGIRRRLGAWKATVAATVP
jgi:hypothetical protein